MKICSRCQLPKEAEEFYARQGKCKECMRDISKQRWADRLTVKPSQADSWHKLSEINIEASTAYCSRCQEVVRLVVRPGKYECWNKRAERNRNWTLKAKYGITLETFNTMLAAQHGRCLTCLRIPTEFVVDHNHKCCPSEKTCGECVRGIICHPCNTMIGHIETNNVDLSHVQAYLNGSVRSQVAE